MTLFLLLLATTGAAFAEESPPSGYCFSLEKLQQATASCADNAAFAEAARRCVEKLRGERSGLGRALAELMKRKSRGAGGSPGESFEAQVGNLDAYLGTLGGVLDSASRAKNDMLLFEGYLKWPHAVEAATLENGKLEQAFASDGCFTQNLGVLRRKVREMDSEIQSLEQDQKDVAALRADLQSRLEKIASAGSVAPVRNGRAPASSAPAAPAPVRRQRDSTITGKIEEKKP